MNFNLKIRKIKFLDRKGLAFVWLALFLLTLLLMFAGLAIDISFMYLAENDLQVASDAACLAGAAELSGTTDVAQSDARKEAWKFACKNTAAGDNVFLVDSGANCDSPPGDLNSSLNDPAGDIVVGNWDKTLSPQFDSTRTPINAIQVVARRTNANAVPTVSIGGNPVGVFWGKIFGMIGTDWSFMNARTDSICALTEPQTVPLPICLPSCSLKTPLGFKWGYDKNEVDWGRVYCTEEALSSSTDPPGQQFFLESSSQSGTPPFKPGLAWTNFDINECGTNPACQDPPNPGEVLPYILGTQTPPDICKEKICTTNGTMGGLVGNQGDSAGDPTLRGQFLAKKGPIDINGTTIDGWDVLVPVVSTESCGPAAQVCPGAQGGAANPYKVEYFARVAVTDVITTGKHGIRLIGLESPDPSWVSPAFNCKSDPKGAPPKTITRLVTSLTCPDCDDPLPPGVDTNVRLVK
jgi:Flp pilus assembly protein TadG